MQAVRVVIFRADKIGDLIVSTPVFAAIKTRHPNAEIMMVASPYNAVALDGMPGVDRTVIYDKHAAPKLRNQTLEAIRAFKPTHALVLSPKNDCYFLALFSGAKIRGGMVSEYRFLPRMLAPLLLTHRRLIPRKGPRPHQTDMALGLTRDMGIGAEGDFHYRLARLPGPREQAKARLIEKHIISDYIAVHLSDKWAEGWSGDDLVNFLKKVTQTTGLPVIATAGPFDKITAGAVQGKIPMLTNLPFHEWAAILDMAKMVIAPDNAPVHIACALEKPLLALYPSLNKNEAMSEFGPRGTRFITRILSSAEKDIPLFLEDVKSLLA